MPRKQTVTNVPGKPRLIEAFDYMSIDFGNGRRFTTGWSGQKATGAVPNTAWTWMLSVLNGKVEGAGKDYGERMRFIVDHVGEVWPQWNVPPRKYAVGEDVQMDFGKKRGGLRKGKVERVARTTVWVRWDDGQLIGVTADMLDAGHF